MPQPFITLAALSSASKVGLRLWGSPPARCLTPDGVLKAYQDGLAISETLARQGTTNAQRQLDLVVSTAL